MSGNSNFADYEPLQNDRRRKTPAEDDSGFRKSPPLTSENEFATLRKSSIDENRPDLSAASSTLIEQELPTSTDSPTQPQLPNDLRTSGVSAFILKSGHAVSFAGLYIFTFLVFFRPYEWSPSLMWLSKSALITALVTLLVFLPTQLGLENRLTLRSREVNMVLLLLLLGLISLPQANDKLLAWNSFVEFSKVVVMFIVMVNVLRTLGRVKALWLLILLASLVLSVRAVLDYRAGRLALGTRIGGAIGGLFENPNDLALHLVTFLPIVFALALAARNPFSKLVYAIATLILVVGTVVTFSRGGFLGLLVTFAVLSWRLVKQNRPFVIVGAAMLLAGFLLLAPGAYRTRIATTKDDSAAARTDELKRSIYVSIRHPLLGVGMDNYILYSNTNHATHNAYTQVSSEIGIPAAIIYVVFLVSAVRRVQRIPHPRDSIGKKKALSYLAIGIHASLIGYMVTSFFASVAYLWYVYYLAAYAISISRFWEAASSDEQPLRPSIPVV